MNTELFQKIHEQISARPETHDQNDWESDCGTTRCVAGWALYFERKPGETVVDETVTRLRFPLEHVGSAAESILGLPEDVAEWLFYDSSNTEAAEFVRLVATGGETDPYRALERAESWTE